MHRIFGRKKAAETPEAPDLTETVKGIDTRVAALDEKIAQCDTELRQYKQRIAKARGAAKQSYQQRAVQVLKRKRMYEQQRDSLAAQSFNVEQTSFAISTVKDTAETVKSMEQAATHLKQQFKQIDLDRVEDLQDQLTDLMMDSEEVQEIMSRAYGTPADVNEDDLMDELGALEDEWAAEEEMGAGVPSYLQPSP